MIYKLAFHRLVYRVDDGQIAVLVLSIGKRDKLLAYRKARERLP